MFGKQEKKPENKRLKILGIFALIIQALVWIILFFKPKKWQRLIKREKKEINQLSEGKQDFARFAADSTKLIKDFFIPHEGNNHKPKILRPKSLLSYALIAVAVKLAVAGFLFTTYPTPAELSAIISGNMISLLNQSRTEAEIEPLKENLTLLKFAEEKAKDMISRDYFSHDTPEGKRPWQWINRAEYDYVYAGENLAMDFHTAEVVHAAFMKSPSHRRNILNPKYKDVAIAVLTGEIDGHATTLLVEFFGTQKEDLSTLALAKPLSPETNEVPPATITTEQGTTAGVTEKAEIILPVDEDFDRLAAGSANEGVIVIAANQKNSRALVDLVIEYSNIFFLAFLIFILLSLILNIFIKIRIQHASVILQSVIVIALMAAMVLIKLHFVEQVAPHLLIL